MLNGIEVAFDNDALETNMLLLFKQRKLGLHRFEAL
jgi:hypothetical protein